MTPIEDHDNHSQAGNLHFSPSGFRGNNAIAGALPMAFERSLSRPFRCERRRKKRQQAGGCPIDAVHH